MSVRELAKLSGVSHSHITDIENGRTIPSQCVILKISKAFKLRADEVFLLDWNKLDL